MSQAVFSLLQTACGPSGTEHAVSLRFTPACLAQKKRFKVIRNLILAKGNILHVYDVCIEEEPLSNGHANGASTSSGPPTKLIHVREHLLHGIVTGLQRIRTTDSEKDGLHRLLVSFRDAKMAILEWDAELHDVVPVSLHSYERLPQIAPILGEGAVGHPLLRADPSSRCAALLLPASINTGAINTLAVLPLFKDQLENEDLALDEEIGMGDLPYAPSYTIDLSSAIDAKVHRVADFCFLPGFTEPTLAIIYQSAGTETWTGRLENHRDSFGLVILTLAGQTPTVILDCPHPLPHSCQRIFACPPQLGGVLIVTADACIHLDQSGKFTGCAANGWHRRSSALPLPTGATPGLALDGALVTFLSPIVALLTLRDGSVHSLVIERDGRSLAAMRLSKFPLVKTVAVSALENVGREFLFVASATGDSVLLRWRLEGGTAKGEQEEENSMDIDALDAMLYGSSSDDSGATDVKLEMVDARPAYGSLRQAAMGPVDHDYPPEVVAASGGHSSGTLTALYRGVPPRKKRRLDPSTEENSSKIWVTNAAKQSHALFASDSSSTKLYYLDEQAGEPVPTLDRTEQSATLGVSTFLDDQKICWVTDRHVRLLNPDLSDAQPPFALKASPPVQEVAFADPYVLLKRNDGTVSLLQGDESVISKKPIELGKKAYAGAALFHDRQDALQIYKKGSVKQPMAIKQEPSTDKMAVDDEDAALYGETPQTATLPKSFDESLKQAMAEPERDDKFERQGVFLAALQADGHFELFALPNRKQAVFSAAGVLDLPDAFADGQQVAPVPPGAETTESAQVEAFCFTLLGESRRTPHLLILLDNGLLVAYEGVQDTLESHVNRSGIRLRFVKVLAQQLEPQADGQPPRELVSLTLRGLAGVFLTGSDPTWLLRTDGGALRAISSQVKPVTSIAASPFSSNDYFAVTDEGMVAYELPELHYDRNVPWQTLCRGRPFSHLVYDGPSQTYVGAGVYEAPFQQYDEEGEPSWEPDAPDLLHASNLRSTLELIIPGTFEVVDGHEFRQNESVLSMASVSVNTHSTLSGRRQYICCGTAIFKGEDITTRGAIYMFEIVPVLDEDGEPSAWNRKLRLRFTEDLKSAIDNVGSLDGYVYHSMGQKIFCKGWEQDERLLAVAFLDVAYATTTIVPMKNFLLVGDHVRGLTFVGFQEDPYKLLALGKETRCGTVATSDFLIHEGRVVFVITDLQGVVRVIEYNPAHPEARSGERLLLRTEFQGSSEIASTIAFGRRNDLESSSQQSGVLLVGMDGSLTTIMPVRDPVYRRLALLERQLHRQLPNRPAALNARAYRTVRNDFVSRALNKGVLDGLLLSRFAGLPLSRQEDLASHIGTDLDTLGLNIQRSRGPWG